MEHDPGEGVGNSWAEEEQLALADEDEDLPWLEADEYEEEGGFDWRLVTYALLGLAVVGAALAALWFGLRDRPDAELVADGSTIEAPEGAYKQRPDDPGGTEVAGTGDQAFEVAEGESTRSRIADNDQTASAARPTIDRNQNGSSSESGSTDAAPAADSSGAVYVQIGAFGSESDAETAWNSASGRYSALSGLRHRVVEADVNGAKVYRLQAIAGNRSSADATCRAIRNAGGDCYIR
ncbi:hypothetical protein AAV99_00900 [Aurantiacibacter marinus]|uniref:SPOR domain-containing protein n=1 Tax=Aurantiacibacter marinus TaxID=874156 RepID=A0A0H0XR57_9SPHN|nr:hypothetical protein AAV99_00900 [Aurantiacibacter marinus]